MDDYNPFEINTGMMYSELHMMDDILPREFFYEYERNLEDLLYHKKLNNLLLPYDDDYTNSKLKENAFHSKHHLDTNYRPFTWFFIKESKQIDGYELVDYLHQYVVDKTLDEAYFDYFFAVRLLLIDVMKIRGFLYYQFEKNFSQDVKSYEVFLHDMQIKYKDFLQDGRRDVIMSKVVEELKNGNSELQSTQLQESERTSLAIKVLAIHYLIKTIEPDLKRKDAAKARFIRMLTDQSSDNIYKMVQSPLSSKSGNLRIEEIEIVRKHFSDLGLNSALEIISKDYK